MILSHLSEEANTMAQKINEAVELMRFMKLPGMAESYEKQLKNPSYQNISFEKRLLELLSSENDSRINHAVERYIANGKLPLSSADFIDLNKDPQRKLPLDLIEALQSNDYLKEGLNIIIIGATGSGKTWLSCAYGFLAARSRFKIRYYRLPELLSDLESARIQNRYRQFIKRFGKIDLLIIDDFLLTETNQTERNDILEIMEVRTNRKSTIFASQFSPEGWHSRLGKGPVADAILDRITNSSYTIFLQGKSLRETYSKIK